MGLTTYFLYMLARRIPMILVTAGGIGFAIIRWKRHPRVSLMTVLALVLFWIEAVVLLCIRYWLPNFVETMKMSSAAINALFVIIGVVDDFAFAAIIILLVAAAFTGRKSSTAMSN